MRVSTMSKTGIAVISLFTNNFVFEELKDGKNSLDLINELIKTFNFDNLAVHFYKEGETAYEGYFEHSVAVKSDMYSLMQSMEEQFKDCENILIINSDCPLTNLQITEELHNRHLKEIAEYSFCENYPEGFTPIIIDKQTLVKLRLIAYGNNEEYERITVHKFINFDINSYDIETMIAEKDMRPERLSLTVENKRKYQIVKNILKNIDKRPAEITFSDILSLIDARSEILRTYPAYFEIEITNDCNLSCIMCARNLMQREIQQMPLEKYKDLVSEISKFCDDAYICLSFMGEPTLHKDLLAMIEYTLTFPKLKLIIETNGVLFDKELANKILNIDSQNLYIIFNLSSPNQELYKKIYGSDAFDTVEEHISYFLNKKKLNVYLQYVRLNINEEEIRDFFERWKGFDDNIIIVKYNDYRGEIGDNLSKPVDLSPINRFPCWHLKRDMVILSNGDVVLCKQCYDGQKTFGNVFSEPFETIWKKIEPFYKNDHENKIDDFCQKCDEWFTYNF